MPKAVAKPFNARLFVGNVPFDIGADRLADLFDAHGIVIDAQVPADPATGKAIGYGFVTMATEAHCKAAIAALDGTKVGERKIEVRFADVKVKKPPRAKSGRKAAPGRAARLPAHLRPEADRDTPQAIVSRPAVSARGFVVEKRRLGPPLRRG